MDNSKLTVTVRNKVPEISYGDYLVSDNKQLKIVFDLDGEWSAYEYKTARFDLDGWQFEIAFTGDTVTLPLLPAYTGELKAGLYAGDLATTTAVSIPVRDSVLATRGSVSVDDAAEIARVAAEAARVEAENARATAEAQRRIAESARQAAEELRTAAENERISAEQTRLANEAARQAAERTRSANESTRTSAESERVRSEDARELAEYRRDLAEQARQAAEDARASAETARASAETVRDTQEARRSSSEEARAAAESERIWSENLRAAAENLRASEENTRAAQERARNSAELIREQNEAQRVRNELDRIAAELARDARIAAVIDEFDDYMDGNDVFKVLAIIREYGMKQAMRLFCEAYAPLFGLDSALLRFFTAAGACVSETYTSAFYLYTTSPSPVGWKKDDNYGLVCEPSTNETAGRDDYADLPLFACFDCNYTIDSTTREPVISAVKGVYGNFSSAPANSFVGVLQMTGWVRRSIDATTKTVEYAAYKKDAGFKPLPEAVRASDNSVRPFVIHAKYAAGFDSQNKLSSVSGVMPVSGRPASGGGINIGRSAHIAAWSALGSQYTSSSICDQAFLQTMLEIKYANLGSVNIMPDCFNYDFAFTAAVSESGVKRILLTPEQAEAFVVGSSVSLGTSSSRSSADCYDICGITRIASIGTVTLNGTNYGAITLDSDETFDTAAGSTYIVTHAWHTGSTDAVLGNDGSPFGMQSGKEPVKLQGIEIGIGLSEIALDTVMSLGSSGPIKVKVQRTPDGELVSIGTTPRGASQGMLQGVQELNAAANDPKSYMLRTAKGGTVAQGYCSMWYLAAASQTSDRMYGMYGNVTTTGNGGIAYTRGGSQFTTSDFTYGCRICGTAGNRGVYTESAGALG